MVGWHFDIDPAGVGVAGRHERGHCGCCGRRVPHLATVGDQARSGRLSSRAVTPQVAAARSRPVTFVPAVAIHVVDGQCDRACGR